MRLFVMGLIIPLFVILAGCSSGPIQEQIEATVNARLTMAASNSSATTPPTSTPARKPTYPPTWTPTPIDPPTPVDECHSQTKTYLAEIGQNVLTFLDTVKVAQSTARISLASVIQDLQGIKRDIEMNNPPACAQPAAKLLATGMNTQIDALLDFLGQVNEATVNDRLMQGQIDMLNGAQQLQAIADGLPTPVPQTLPTLAATVGIVAAPTITPIPTGKPITVVTDDGTWSVVIDRVEQADSITSNVTGMVEGAQGRYALVWLKATNTGKSSQFFSPIGTFVIEDEFGQHYEYNELATLYANNNKGLEDSAMLNPSQNTRMVIVFDIPKESKKYVLVPGTLAMGSNFRAELNLP